MSRGDEPEAPDVPDNPPPVDGQGVAPSAASVQSMYAPHLPGADQPSSQPAQNMQNTWNHSAHGLHATHNNYPPTTPLPPPNLSTSVGSGSAGAPAPRSPPRTRYLGYVPLNQTSFWNEMYNPGQRRLEPSFPEPAEESPRWDIESQSAPRSSPSLPDPSDIDFTSTIRPCSEATPLTSTPQANNGTHSFANGPPGPSASLGGVSDTTSSQPPLSIPSHTPQPPANPSSHPACLSSSSSPQPLVHSMFTGFGRASRPISISSGQTSLGRASQPIYVSSQGSTVGSAGPPMAPMPGQPPFDGYQSFFNWAASATRPLAPSTTDSPVPQSPGSTIDLTYTTQDEGTPGPNEHAEPPPPAPKRAPKRKAGAPGDSPNKDAKSKPARPPPKKPKPGKHAKPDGGKKVPKGKGKGTGKGKGKAPELDDDELEEAALDLEDSADGGSDMDEDLVPVKSSRHTKEDKMFLLHIWFDPETYKGNIANKAARIREITERKELGGRWTAKQITDFLASMKRKYALYETMMGRSGTDRPDEEDQRALLQSHGGKFTYEHMCEFGESEQYDILNAAWVSILLQKRPEIRKLLNVHSGQDLVSDPVEETPGASDIEGEDESGSLSKSKGKRRARDSSRHDVQVAHGADTEMMDFLHSAVNELQTAREDMNTIQRGQLEISQLREQREDRDNYARSIREAWQLRMQQIRDIGEWYRSGLPYLMAQAQEMEQRHAANPLPEDPTISSPRPPVTFAIPALPVRSNNPIQVPSRSILPQALNPPQPTAQPTVHESMAPSVPLPPPLSVVPFAPTLSSTTGASGSALVASSAVPLGSLQVMQAGDVQDEDQAEGAKMIPPTGPMDI